MERLLCPTEPHCTDPRAAYRCPKPYIRSGAWTTMPVSVFWPGRRMITGFRRFSAGSGVTSPHTSPATAIAGGGNSQEGDGRRRKVHGACRDAVALQAGKLIISAQHEVTPV